MDFDEFFRSATGSEPYDYQRALGTASDPPSVLEVPTGAGKTNAALTAWLFQRRHQDAPRRLVYALPMRSLVEQTAEVARTIRTRLGLTADELPIHVLMGGEAPTDWRLHPEREQILVGTMDMLLSRALNRGYGESRFAWPVSFGLLNADCRWIFDEVQLMGPARATSAQLDGLRHALGVAAPVQTMWMSATVDREALRTVDRPELGEVLELSSADRAGPLSKRLEATKVLRRLDMAAEKSEAAAIAEAAAAEHQPGTRTLVVVNTVRKAQDIQKRLERHLARHENAPSLTLLHSRFRPGDRADRMAEATAAVADAGTIVVATQVIEAGLDISSALLITEAAPFSSIVQRLGRCNREGELPAARVLWIDAGPATEKTAAPYELADVEATRSELSALEGASLSPACLAEIDVRELRTDPLILRRRDLVDLFDTAPDLSGLDIDISRFIRDGDERTVSVFFRDLTDAAAAAEQPMPDRDELVDVPVLKAWTDKRPTWIIDPVDGEWRRAPERLVPGSLVMLAAADGGYNAMRGWDQDRLHKEAVDVLESGKRAAVEGMADDPWSENRSWVTLSQHLDDALREATAITDRLDGWVAAHKDAIAAAAALHDVGKAHPGFQEMLLSSVPDGAEQPDTSIAWAKSAHSGGHHKRKFFRHELASALAIRTWDGQTGLSGRDHDLLAYLVAAHHGRVRLSIRPAADEPAPKDRGVSRWALGVWEGDVLPAVETPRGPLPAVTLTLGCMELGGEGRSWAEVARGLLADPDLGHLRLAYLEALVRVADWRASG